MRHSTIAIAALIIAAAALLAVRSFPASACSSLCVTVLHRQGDLVATAVRYSGAPLSDSLFYVAENGRTFSLRTGGNGSLSFYTPLGIGFNNINFSYGGSISEVSLFSLAGYSGFLYLFLGAAAYLLARRLSESGLFWEKVYISYEGGPLSRRRPPLQGIPAGEIMALARSDADRNNAVPGLPVTLRQALRAVSILRDAPSGGRKIYEEVVCSLSRAGYRVSGNGAVVDISGERQPYDIASVTAYERMMSGLSPSGKFLPPLPLSSISADGSQFPSMLRRARKRRMPALLYAEDFRAWRAAGGMVLLPYGPGPLLLLARLSGFYSVVQCWE